MTALNRAQVEAAILNGDFDDAVRKRAWDLQVEEMDRWYRDIGLGPLDDPDEVMPE